MTIKTATATTTNQQPVCPDTLTPACCCDIDDDCSDGDDDWCCPAAGHCVAKDSDCKYICTHDEDLEAHPLHDNGGADSDGGAGNNGAKQQSRRPRCSAEFTQQGEAPTCTNGADALCCDIDGSCLDGDDDWCTCDALTLQLYTACMPTILKERLYTDYETDSTRVPWLLYRL